MSALRQAPPPPDRIYGCLRCHARLGAVRRGEVAVCVRCGQGHVLGRGGMLVRAPEEAAGGGPRDRAQGATADRLARRLSPTEAAAARATSARPDPGAARRADVWAHADGTEHTAVGPLGCFRCAQIRRGIR